MTRISRPDSNRPRVSRRRLFELGGATAAAAMLAACGDDSDSGDGSPGRLGYAPPGSPLPGETVDDGVYLRTMTSLEASFIAAYERFADESGLGDDAAAALARFLDDHVSARDELITLTEAAGAEVYDCPNPWYEHRFFGEAIDHVFGDADAEPEIPVSDDIPADTTAMMFAFERLASSSYLRFVGLVSTPELRGEMATQAAAAARRASTTALLANRPPSGYVAPELLAADAALADEFGDVSEPADGDRPVPYAISSRFAQLTPVPIEIGAPDNVGLRSYRATFETPAENAYVYADLTC